MKSFFATAAALITASQAVDVEKLSYTPYRTTRSSYSNSHYAPVTKYSSTPSYVSKYSIPTTTTHSYPTPTPTHSYPAPTPKRCATVDFSWNFFGIDGSLDIWTSGSGVRMSGDLMDLSPGGHEMYVKRLPVGSGLDNCKKLGRTFTYVGRANADYEGDAHLNVWNKTSIDDLIGKSVEIRGRYRDYGITPRAAGTDTTTITTPEAGNDYTASQGPFRTLDVQACGNIVEIACP